MPWTLYRYILTDLLRLLLLCLAVLVSVVSFVVAIKPMSDGVLSPLGLPRYVLYMMPMILVIVLPFAAAFASTMVFNRLTNDNEVLACRAMGLSYPVILLPVMLLGAGLMAGQYTLSNYVVPRFYMAAERLLQTDVTRVVVSHINKGQTMELLDGWVLYADAVDDSQPPPVVPDSVVQPSRLIMLRGVAVGRLDDQGRLRSDSTAEQADVLVWHESDNTWVTIGLSNVTHFDPTTGRMEMGEVGASRIPPLLVPNPFEEQTMFLSLSELRKIADDPEQYRKVRTAKRRLEQAMAARQLLNRLDDSLAGPQGKRGVELLGPAGQVYTLTAPLVVRASRGDTLLLRAGADLTPVRVDRQEGGTVIRRIEAQQGSLKIVAGDPDPEPRVVIELTDAREFDTRVAGRGTEHNQITLPRLRWREPLVPALSRQSSLNLVRQARKLGGPDTAVGDAAARLRTVLYKLGRNIVAQFHSRAASAVICLFVIVFGALLSILLKGQMPLVVFLWCFLLALVAVLIARSGDNFATDSRYRSIVPGLLMIWTGNALLALACAGAYLKLRRT